MNLILITTDKYMMVVIIPASSILTFLVVMGISIATIMTIVINIILTTVIVKNPEGSH